MEKPVIALRGLSVLPNMSAHYDVSRDKSAAALDKAMESDQMVFLVTQRDPELEEPEQEDLFRFGVTARIKQVLKMPSSLTRVTVEGLTRGKLMTLDTSGDYLVGEVEDSPLGDIAGELDPLTQEGFVRIIGDRLKVFGMEVMPVGKQIVPRLLKIKELDVLLYQIGISLPLEYEARQSILDAESYLELFAYEEKLISHETDIARIKKEFQIKVRDRIDKNQKEYILREQMKVIREELGEENTGSEADDYIKQCDALTASDEIKERIRKEIARFRTTPLGQESAVMRTYIETLLELPWDRQSEENIDIKHAREILDADHYGLEKVKERILEHLAVRRLTDKGEAPILCLVGPPGTGKTSIARSVARALGRNYVRICLGGVRDEAEIRGHRRTYVGAMPGRIAAGLKQAGVANPLMLLDEIDKVSSDYKGDTASALLEVLDSEQNNKFRDHYVELPLDLSEVLFIATANTTETIARPLLDRMEIIEVNSYTVNEKFHIAENYLISKQMKKNGLLPAQLSISKKALQKIILNYTREAGVRNLERRIGDICRKAAKEILEENKSSVRVTENSLEKYLGIERVSFDMANETDEVGIVRGLAWTSVGGDTLQIEVNVMPGSGKIQLTGQMGDVMKESAQTAISYIRSIGPDFQIEEDFFDKHDIHIHIPEGAVPKDGPSAGITMATAILSAVIDRKVKADLAMTGEVTLRGRVLPIGGLKEKLLAAKMANIHHVLVPEKNRPDVAELSAEITRGLDIAYVSAMDEVIQQALV